MGIKFIPIVLLNTYLSSSASLKIKRTVAKSSLKELGRVDLCGMKNKQHEDKV